MPSTSLNQRRRFTSLLTILTTVALLLGQTSRGFAQSNQERPLSLLVLGDSVLWGEGLKPEHKAWYQVQKWLATRTNGEVLVHVEAHSGAVIDAGNVAEPLTTLDGELNSALPTVNGQVDRALRFYGDGGRVDLVLVNGCANDIGTKTLLNAGLTPVEIRSLAQTKCGPPVESLLRKITTSFVNARVVITGYYPFFSERTHNDFFVKAMARKFFEGKAGAPKLSSKAVLARLTENSQEWFQASNQSMTEAVARVNSELLHSGGRARIAFAGVNFLPEHSFGAKESRLWELDPSPFKRLLVLLSLGKIPLETDDEQRRRRNSLCNELYRQPAQETREQRLDRRNRRLTCRYAALGHPNRKGAQHYADEIIRQLKSLEKN